MIIEGEATKVKASEKQFDVERVYVKKSTLELIDAPASFVIEGKPDINFEIKNSYLKLSQEHLYEVTLKVTMKVKIVDKDKSIDKEFCMCDVEQCGIFKLHGFSEAEAKPLLLGYCPDVLYPYARHTVAELLTSGSVPPVLLKPISFESIYQQQLQKQKEQGSASKNEIIH